MADKRPLLFVLGRPLSPVYSLLMRLRAWLYRRNIFKRTKLSVPVISIGNLTLGGTGKTPMVMYIAKEILKAGKRPVVVSRGYGGLAKGPVNIVADGVNVLLSSSQAGDEPRLIADSLPGVAVLTGNKRALVGQQAIDLFNPDFIVLDDGFQHLALARDVDIVLFNGQSLLADGRVFPGGILREPLAALGRARCFMITGAPTASCRRLDNFKQFLHKNFPAVPIFTAAYKAVSLVNQDGQRVDLAQWRSRKLLAFCGLAEPDSFRKTLESEDMQLSGFEVFNDHYRYSATDLNNLSSQALKSGAEALITTEKDLVKLAAINAELPLLALQVQLVPEVEFSNFLADFL